MDNNSLQLHENNEAPPSGFPARLKFFREQLHLSKSDLAENAGVTYRTVHNLETDSSRNPQDKTLLLLAKALGITFAELQGNGSADFTKSATTSPKRLRALLFSLAIFAILTISTLTVFSLSQANWEITDNGLEVRDKLAGISLWRYETTAKIHICQEAPWDSDILLVGLWFNSPKGGRLVALDRRTGEQLWEIQPDVDQLRDVFGSEVIDTAPFGAHRVMGWDSNGDGTPEGVVNFVHGTYFPSVLCAFDAKGNVFGQYNLNGHVKEIVAWDLNEDGRDELIISGTNNASAYQGATVIILNREHFKGATIDSLAAPHPTMPDSALARVVFPAYPEPFMQHTSSVRLTAQRIQIFRNARGETNISITIGENPLERILVYLDAELHPIRSDIFDTFRATLQAWPDSLTSNTGPADDKWRANWLATHRHFRAGHWPPAKN
ncbi:MAG: helix-turn-helix domain-containing protein [Gemmatimonadales bacterium]|nr:helix-turn-helix domain-containing protein [Gemmatimonadales bacterium]